LRRRLGYERTRRLNRYWFDAARDVEFSALCSYDSDDFLKDICFSLDRLREAGLDRVIVADLTRRETGVPVVRVVVPGLECYAMDQDRIGRRCTNARNNRLSGAKSAAR